MGAAVAQPAVEIGLFVAEERGGGANGVNEPPKSGKDAALNVCGLGRPDLRRMCGTTFIEGRASQQRKGAARFASGPLSKGELSSAGCPCDCRNGWGAPASSITAASLTAIPKSRRGAKRTSEPARRPR